MGKFAKILVPAVIGCLLLFTPMDRLVAAIGWLPLPMPPKGTPLYIAMMVIWRAAGVVALLTSGFAAFAILRYSQ